MTGSTFFFFLKYNKIFCLCLVYFKSFISDLSETEAKEAVHSELKEKITVTLLVL